MATYKRDYIIYDFDFLNVQEAMDWINEKANRGYKVINIHYYDIEKIKKVRYVLEFEDL
jgi:hypothetical protein